MKDRSEEFLNLLNELSGVYVGEENGADERLGAVVRLLRDRYCSELEKSHSASLALVGHLRRQSDIETCLGRLLAFAPGVVLFVPDGQEVPLGRVALLARFDGRSQTVTSRTLDGSNCGLNLARPPSPEGHKTPGDIMWIDGEIEPASGVFLDCTTDRLHRLDDFLAKWLPV